MNARPVLSMRRAVVVNAVGRYVRILAGLVLGAVLARLLPPEDFGMIAVVTVFTTFFSMFSTLGLSTAVIQKRELTDADLRSIGGLMFYVALALTAVFFLASSGIAAFYGNAAYAGIGRLLSVSLFFNALDTVPAGILARDKKFRWISAGNVIVYMASAGIAIVLALRGFGVYALVCQSILSAVFTWLWDAAGSRFFISFRVRRESIALVRSYAGFDFAFSFVNYFARNLDNLLAGRFFGEAALGLYNKAYSLMQQPVRNLGGVVSPVLHPYFSDHQDEPDTIYVQYMKVVRFMACLGLFIAPMCALAGREIILIIYGAQWEASVICFQLMSFSLVTQMINSCTGAVFRSLGRTDLLFANGAINSAVNVAAILVGILAGGTIGRLALCVSCAYLVHFLTAQGMLVKMGFRRSFAAFLRELAPQGIMAAAMIAAAAVFTLFPMRTESLVIALIAKVFWLAAVYAAVLFATRQHRLLREIAGRRHDAEKADDGVLDQTDE